MLNKQQIIEIFTRFKDNKPNPKIELEYASAYTLIVAVILSAQATDKSVNLVTPNLYKVADTPSKMINLGVDNLKEHIRSIGLYNAKAKNIIAMSQMLIDKFNGEVPPKRDDLEKLPGVGRKSANIVLSLVFNEPTLAVDTHVFRIAHRIGFCKEKDVRKTEDKLMKKVPMQFMDNAHYWLVLHGRYVCKARKPLCGQCIINDICKYKHKVY